MKEAGGKSVCSMCLKCFMREVMRLCQAAMPVGAAPGVCQGLSYSQRPGGQGHWGSPSPGTGHLGTVPGLAHGTWAWGWAWLSRAHGWAGELGPGPAVALLGQGLMALGMMWGPGPAQVGEAPEEGVRFLIFSPQTSEALKQDSH